MSVDSDVEAAAVATAPVVPVGNPALLGLITFLPSGITLGLWFVNYLPLGVPGGMVAIVGFSAGLFLMLAALWAARLANNAVAAIFGVFSAFWLSFSFLVMGLVNDWFGVGAAAEAAVAADPALDAAAAAGGVVADIQAAYLLSFLLVFILLTLSTLRLPLTFTVGFLLVCATFLLAFLGVTGGNVSLFTLAGITTFGFCAVFAYILWDGMTQELGGRALPLGRALRT